MPQIWLIVVAAKGSFDQWSQFDLAIILFHLNMLKILYLFGILWSIYHHSFK